MKRTMLLLALIGCTPATRFHGSPKVESPNSCAATCASWGMDLAGMVQMGEYSNGCICRVRQPGAAAPMPTATPAGAPPVSVAPDEDVLSAGAAVAAATAVMVTMEEDDAQQRRNQPPASPRK